MFYSVHSISNITVLWWWRIWRTFAPLKTISNSTSSSSDYSAVYSTVFTIALLRVAYLPGCYLRMAYSTVLHQQYC